ncbi:MAG: hypothetical protein HYR84_03185 [Planctomycetes bacterium]|nr:hypothetical protein [Planctomycetota bacterium]
MIERIRELYWAKPFVPFAIHTTDGRSVSVSHPEFMALGPDGGTVSVYEANGPLHTINVAMVTDVALSPAAAGSKA